MNRTFDRLHSFRFLLAGLTMAVLPASFASAQAVCNQDAAERAKASFQRMVEQRKVFRDSVSDSAFRYAAEHYMRFAQECYEARYGAREPTLIDEGGVWAEAGGPAGEFNTDGRKWGAGSPYPGGQDIPGPGIPGGTVTYSYMSNAVDTAGENADPTNTAITSLPTFQPCFIPEIDLQFDAWEAVSDIQFVQVPDNGLPYNAPGAAGDIRVGSHVFDGSSGALAHAYFPPPNSVSLAGDVHLNRAEDWQCTPAVGFDVGIVILHELGHSIGLGHEPCCSHRHYANIRAGFRRARVLATFRTAGPARGGSQRRQLAARFAALLTRCALLRCSESRSSRFSSRPKYTSSGVRRERRAGSFHCAHRGARVGT